MATHQRCPICAKGSCTVARDGQSGYCKKHKRKWEVKNVPVSELKPGPIRHTELPPFLLDIIHWTYKIVGRYIHSTLEQWEVGFMRDMNVVQEVMFWHRASMAFITYHKRKGIGLRQDEEEKKLIGYFISEPEGQGAESKLIRDCFESPDDGTRKSNECRRRQLLKMVAGLRQTDWRIGQIETRLAMQAMAP